MKKEHAYKKIEQDIKNNVLKNIVVLYGKEQYLVKWSVDQIVKKYINDDCAEMDFSAIDPEKATASSIIENCETLSLLSEKRVVYLPGFTPLWESSVKNFPEESIKELAAYIKNIPDTSILIITAENVDKRKKLYKEIVSYGSVYDFDSLDEPTLKGFIEKRVKVSGKKVKASVISQLIEHSGYFHKETEYTLYNLENDIKKIAAHCEGDEILLTDVLSVVSGDLETNVFAMIDAVSKNQKGEAFQMLYNLLGNGSSIFMILSLLASQFETILEVKELRNEGKLMAQMQSVLNIHEFRIKKAGSFADQFSIERLREILKKIYQVEKDIKSGMMEQTLALEVLILEI